MKTDVTSEPIFLNPFGLLEEGDSSERVLRFLCSHELLPLVGQTHAALRNATERFGQMREGLETRWRFAASIRRT